METAEPLYGLPGTHLIAGQFIVHRSHLPLLENPEAQSILSAPASSVDWSLRDRWTAERGFKLRTTQHQAIDFITAHGGALLGDDMRLGKTLSAIMSHDPRRGKLVVIAPLSTRAVWMGWMRRVFPDLSIGLIIGRKYKADVFDHPIVLGHYDVISKWQIAMKIGTLVFDEAHMLTNRDAERSKAAGVLRSRSELTIAMTGTPIWKMPPDLWNVIGLVAPGAWGGYHEFAQRYGAPEETGYGAKYTGASNVAELNLRMSEVMLRRRWMDVADDLPPITRTVVVADLNQTERNRLDIIAGKLKTERANTIGMLAAYRKSVSTIKLPTVIRETEKVLDRLAPVVVWTWHREFATKIVDRLIEHGRPAFLITGDISPAERERRIDEWKAHPAAALVCTMAVAQVGIDLSHARDTIFGEVDYTPAILGQAEMRTYAPDRPMNVTFIVANHFVDQRIIRALVTKLGAADSLGVGAAVDAIDALREAVIGPDEVGDVDRLLEDFLASAA
jgi:SNF2 family DNA or RNA helicase